MSTHTERRRKGGGNECRMTADSEGPPISYSATNWRKLLPIVLSASDAQKVHAGTKTQVRVLLKLPHGWSIPPAKFHNGMLNRFGCATTADSVRPRYRVGDVLWVQQNWRTSKLFDHVKPTELPHDCGIYFNSEVPLKSSGFGKLRAATTLPLRFARPHRYEVVAVRCERVNAISEADVIAEGIASAPAGEYGTSAFRSQWNSRHTAPGTRFEDSPWVFVYELGRLV